MAGNNTSLLELSKMFSLNQQCAKRRKVRKKEKQTIAGWPHSAGIGNPGSSGLLRLQSALFPEKINSGAR